MPELKINGQTVAVEEGATLLDAAEQIAVEIPTLCHLKTCEPETSCMLCVVKNVQTGQLVPACSAQAVEGLEIDTECDAVQAARRDILNLLLSEHVGDCEAPCTRICPAHLEIPLMLRETERGNMESAGWIAKRDLAIPETLGYVCPAPCEKGCRRSQLDESVKIRHAHRDAASHVDKPLINIEQNGKQVAVLGAGPAGLSCAWALLQKGYTPVVFDEAAQAGGVLRGHDELPTDVLEREIDWLNRAGVVFQLGTAVPDDSGFEAVLEPQEHKLAVMAVANGKKAAAEFEGFPTKRFDSKVGKLRGNEVAELEKNCRGRQGVDDMQVEAARCLHCDCRKPESCKLRIYAERYGADQRVFQADERHHIQLMGNEGSVVYESGKCIKCGLCIKTTKDAEETYGVTFIGRGYNTQVAVPFNEALESGLKRSAEQVVAACPTGALAFRDTEEKLAT